MEITYWKEVRRTHTKIKKKFKLGDLVGKLNKLWYKCDADYKNLNPMTHFLYFIFEDVVSIHSRTQFIPIHIDFRLESTSN